MNASPRLAALAAAALLGACGSSSTKVTTCDVTAQAGCQPGQVCEPVSGGAPACFDPVVVTGHVSDIASGNRLADARVVALDASGAPATKVATSLGAPDDGLFKLRLAATRDASGKPVATSVTLRADRAGYASFPSGLRVALPISTASANHLGAEWVVASSLTEVELSALAAPVPAGAIQGTVTLPAPGAGVLVVAEDGGGAGFTAIPGSDGSFAIFNLPDGTYTLRGYTPGFNYAPVTVTITGGVAAPASAKLIAPAATAATAKVSGSIQLVSSTFWSQTSVLLVVASTYDAARIRGVAPAGLRASGVTSTWSIAGIPDGHYRVLAGFETDYLVRDPSDIAGTAVLEFQVVNGVPLLMDGTTAASTLQGFKITGAVRLKAPLPDATGACSTLAAFPADPGTLPAGPCTTASAAPTFAWEAYAATNLYDVTVVDDTGAVAWRAEINKLDTTVTYGDTSAKVTSTVKAADALVDGRTYQVHVRSIPVGGGSPLSTTEDLLGVFTKVP